MCGSYKLSCYVIPLKATYHGRQVVSSTRGAITSGPHVVRNKVGVGAGEINPSGFIRDMSYICQKSHFKNLARGVLP